MIAEIAKSLRKETALKNATILVATSLLILLGFAASTRKGKEDMEISFMSHPKT